jgi:hypothetical protein
MGRMRRALGAAGFLALTACSLVLGFEHGHPRAIDGGEDGGALDDGGCASCPVPAHGTSLCVDGGCGVACDQDWLDCNGDPRDGCEIDPRGDPRNCGACGARCGPGLVCDITGKCASGCSSGSSECDGGCVDTSRNPAHCGSCANVCPEPANGSATCAGGVCGFSCTAPFRDCDDGGAGTNGCETNTAVDRNNCGACGKVCVAPSGAVVLGCVGGCVYQCGGPPFDCNGDLAEGGACECSPPKVCRAGACQACASIGVTCVLTSECCQDKGPTQCSPAGSCCTARNGACTLPGYCCPGLNCISNQCQ